jgi:hypothetical protein
MAWSASKIFATLIEDALENTAAYNLKTGGDSFKVSLWDNDITPDNTVSTANRAYAAGQWVSAGNEVYDAAEWPVTGQALGGVDLTVAAAVIKWDADDEVSTGTSATLANVYGCMVYDDTVGDSGVCYNYFGGVQSVTDGTFTVVWNSAGIFTLTLT